MVRFGVIGCGVIAPFHGRAISATVDAEIVACCDIIEEKAKIYAEKFGIASTYVDYHEMLKRKDIDCVCICTPSGMHGEMSIDCLRAGKNVLCEKPMEITHAKIDAVIAELDKHPNLKMGCVFQRRVQPIPLAVKKAIESGEFGRPLVADAYLKYYRSPEYYKSADWRATWALDGGGALMNQGVHGIDLISWFMGGIESIYGIARTQTHNIEVEDTAVCAVKYTNGAVGVIEGTTCVYPAQDTRFELHFEKGSIIFSDAGLIQWEKMGEDGKKTETSSEFSAKNDPQAIGQMSHLPIIEDMVKAITTGCDPMVTPREGRKAVDTILAIYESSKLSKEIKLS